MKKFKIKCFCKVNLCLRVIKKISKNYHFIKSFITFCDVHDITISSLFPVSNPIVEPLRCVQNTDGVVYESNTNNNLPQSTTHCRANAVMRCTKIVKRYKINIDIAGNV